MDGRYLSPQGPVDERVLVIRFIFHNPAMHDPAEAPDPRTDFLAASLEVVNHLVAQRFAHELGVEEEIWFVEYHSPRLAIWRRDDSRRPEWAAQRSLDGPTMAVDWSRRLDGSSREARDWLSRRDRLPARRPRGRCTMHAMPVMLGVLAILAVAYRYYSAFLAAKVAALDDTRVTPAHQFNDGQNFDPTNRWVLFGHHFAAISGAGPLIGPGAGDPVRLHAGPGLAGGGRLPGRRRAGHDGPGRLDARGGLSLAGLARQEIGRPAGIAAAIAILYIVIIALAGLGIVVVKALGGEEVPMKAGTVAGLSRRRCGTQHEHDAPAARWIYTIPPGTTYRFGDGPGQTMVFHEPFNLAVPARLVT